MVVEKAASLEQAAHASLQRVLEAEGVVGTEVCRLVEGDAAVGLLREEAVEDDDVEVEVRVEGRARVGAEVVLHPARHALAVGIGLDGVSQEGLEVTLRRSTLCGESRGRSGALPTPPPPFAAAKAIAGCIQLAAEAHTDADIAGRYAERVQRGLELADRIDLWTAPSPGGDGHRS